MREKISKERLAVLTVIFLYASFMAENLNSLVIVKCIISEIEKPGWQLKLSYICGNN